jgi:hypothetical protein
MEKILILEKGKHYGKMYSPSKLPKGYSIKGSPAFQDFFLMHRGKPASRLLMIKKKNKWYNYTLNKKQTPAQALREDKKAEKYFENAKLKKMV